MATANRIAVTLYYSSKGSFTIVNIFVFVQSVRRGEGRGHDASVLFLNVDILLIGLREK